MHIHISLLSEENKNIFFQVDWSQLSYLAQNYLDKLNITLNLISDVSDDQFDNEILRKLEDKKINIKFIKSKINNWRRGE